MRLKGNHMPGWHSGLAILVATCAINAESVVTELAELHRVSGVPAHTVSLEGTVLWANAAAGRLVLQDHSAAKELELDWGNTPVSAGHRVRITGTGLVVPGGNTIRIGARGPTLKNDGVHRMIEKSGAIYLPEGRQPIRVEWFNATDKADLEVQYSGPEFSLRRVPAAALWRETTDATGTRSWLNGLDFQTFSVTGETLPDFAQLPVLKSGTCADFDFGVAEKAEHVGVQFSGYLDVPRAGVHTFHLASDDGSRLFVGRPTMQLTVLGEAQLPEPTPLVIGQLLHDDEDDAWAILEGTVTLAVASGSGLRLELTTNSGRLRVEVANAAGISPNALLRRKVRVTGFSQSAVTPEGMRVPGVLLTPGSQQIQVMESAEEAAARAPVDPTALPVLRTAEQVHRLKREEAQRGYPVLLRGTVTCVLPERQAVILQDSTRGIYVVDESSNGAAQPQIGDDLEVEGSTDPSLFAPIVNAKRLTQMGARQLPVPVQPSWDQLMTGSLDAQFVEVPGIVTAVQESSISLLTRDGIMEIELRGNDLKKNDFNRYEGAMIRVRGCLLALWDFRTHQVRAGAARIYAADILVDEAAPEDLFSTPGKTAAELRLFDPQAGLLQRVKVAGQVLHVSERELFVADHGTGVRCLMKDGASLVVAGDLVEVVGFSELSGAAAPVLREAIVRATGNAPLPAPTVLTTADFSNPLHDATRVQVEGLLVDRRKTAAGWVLELQSGMRTFAARWSRKDLAPTQAELGSRLKVTGVFAVVGGNHGAGEKAGNFELLLNTSDEIRVLARPPFWTPQRLFLSLGILAAVLVFTALWITQLHRKVEQRGTALEKEIHAREQVEQQRIIEQERTRVAQDLHDELGADLTEIGMLLARAQTSATPSERRADYLEQTRTKARQIVTSLDEIVWAMNPTHDSLDSLTSYFCLHADRFLGLAGIAWRLEEVDEPSDHKLDSRRRHQLFIAFKEMLTNVVRHAQATEVRFRISSEAGDVRLTVKDNGRGLPTAPPADGMDGVANLRARCGKLGGRFEIYSDPGQGTTISVSIPIRETL
jgi:signal transduction histidine kinase